MEPIVYEFSKIRHIKYKNFICQYVSGRKLSDIYHSHDFYEFVIIITGSCVQLINGKQHTLKQDDFILFKPYDSHSVLSQSHDVSLIAISVEKNEFESFCKAYESGLISKITEKCPLIFTSPNIYRNISLFCGNSFENCKEYECKFILSYLIKQIIQSTDENSLPLPKNISYALQKIKETENLKDGVSALIKLSGYSRSQLSRHIKRYFNVSLHEYILRLRLDAAYNDVILSNEDLEDISEKLGYASFSHFNKIFKVRFGITPAALRKKHRLWTT